MVGTQVKYLVIILLLAACGPVPVQVSKTSQEQTQRQSVKQEVANDLAADQQSSHQSESKQGTNSMPVIIIGGLRAGLFTPTEELCDVMHGTYDPTAKDICAGGDWVRVIPYIPKPSQ